jgi:hypothetical protein
MALHARQVAMAAGAIGDLVARVAERLVQEGTVRLDRAEAMVREMQGGGVAATPPRRGADPPWQAPMSAVSGRPLTTDSG